MRSILYDMFFFLSIISLFIVALVDFYRNEVPVYSLDMTDYLKGQQKGKFSVLLLLCVTTIDLTTATCDLKSNHSRALIGYVN